MTRGTTRTALVFLALGHVLSALPISLTFLVLLPFRLLGLVLNLVGFRLVFGSRTDDIPKYRWRAFVAPVLYLASLLLWPVIIALFVAFILSEGSVLWEVLFFIALAAAGLLYTMSRSMFQAPLRRGFGKVALVLVVALSLLLTVAAPPLSLLASGYAGSKAHDAIADIGPIVAKKVNPVQEPNVTFNSSAGDGGNITIDGGIIAQYLKAHLYETVRESANRTANMTANIAEEVVVLIIPLLVADIAFSLATLLWLVVLSGSIVTMGRLERRWDETMSPAQPYVVNQDMGPD